MKYFFILGRSPELSLVEIFSYFKKLNININYHNLKENKLLIDLDKKIDSEKTIKSLGGSIAIGEVLFFGGKDSVISQIGNEIVYNGKSNKFTYSLLCISDEKTENDAASSLKNNFRKEKLKARYKNIRISSRGKKNIIVRESPSKMMKTDETYFFVKDKNYFFGRIVASYDTKEGERRDMEKPERRESLAISPKMARILINLSQSKPGKVLLDPFCGAGTIIQEALLQNINSIGVEIKKDAVKGAIKNMQWLRENYKIKSKYQLINKDSSRVKLKNIDSIATEPSLGQFMRKTPNTKIAEGMLRRFENFLIPILNNLKNYLPRNAKVSFTSPCIKTNRGRIGCDIKRIADKTGLKEYSIRGIKFPVEASRKNQILGREFNVLQK